MCLKFTAVRFYMCMCQANKTVRAPL